MVGEAEGEIVKGLDPLLARLTELTEQQNQTNRQILSTLKSIATALGATPVPPTLIGPPAPMPALPASSSVIPLPTGAIRNFSDITTTAAFVTVASIKVSKGKKFQIAKIVASCLSDYEVQLYWNSKAITVIYKQAGKSVLTDWYPYDYGNPDGTAIQGDGNTLLELKGRYPTGGSADDLYGEIVGEEV